MWSMWLVDWNWSQGRNVSLQLSAAVEFISYALQVRWEKSYYALVYRVEPFPPQTGDRAVDGKSVFILFYLERPSDYGQIMDYSFVLTPRPISESKTPLGTLYQHCSPLAESGRLGIAFKVETFCKLQWYVLWFSTAPTGHRMENVWCRSHRGVTG